ncbi:glycerophosphoryl diester phosphodiesterase membrane domain-containing protein [Parasphingorhabdus litoris]|nr:glycerophosphoryl diester phosphodiesterase membrane domain-containing protein [Parasphingorhabdus litoris]
MILLRDHKEAILAIAGVFVFLPTLLMAQFVGEPALDGTEDLNAITAAYSAFFGENALSIILSNLLISFGGFVIFFIIAPSHGGTVGDNLSKALRLFIIFLLANILTGLATFAGLLLFVIPGLYIACRLILVPIIIADHNETNPLEALKGSWDQTKNNGFSILLLILMIAIIGAITVGVVQMLIGVITGLATAGAGWPLIQNVVSALGGSALQILFTVIIGSIYLQLTGQGSDVGEVFN